MPPKRGAKAATVAVKAPPLADCTIAVGGTFPGTSQTAIGELITKLGGTFVKSITAECTHLVATPTELQKGTAKVKAAQNHANVSIVDLSWILASEEDNVKAPEKDHLIAPASQVVAPQTATAGSSSSQQKTNGQSKAKRSASPDTLPSASVKKQKTSPVAAKPKTALATKHKGGYIPQDEGVNAPTHQVYVGPDGTIYDASLNQTNSSNNNNKFYRIQVCNVSHSMSCSVTHTVLGSSPAFHWRCLYLD
jgi:poly [ADP-ribose] polymerase